MIIETKCKALLSKSGIADYCVNCYRGCSHACAYCYAPSVLREKRRWGSFVEVRTNAPETLKKEIKNAPKGKVFISSVTDAYQPVERKYELTRKILEILLEAQFPIEILTKSSLIARDADLIKNFHDAEAGLTITTLDDDARKIFEPNSSPVEEKLQALKTLKDAGINTYAFFGPMLPKISDQNLEGYFDALNGIADFVYVDKLNLKPGTWSKLAPALEKNYPSLVGAWREILFTKNGYYHDLKSRITKISSGMGIKTVFCY
ncbi:MAG: radical SAM protein [Candidatus Aenigmatarchaeota archaeon]